MTERIGRVVQGQELSAAATNRRADAIEQLNDLLASQNAALAEHDAQSQLMRITGVLGTTLQAIAGAGAPSGGETVYNVRLPPELAEASRGGVAITIADVNNATATDGTTNEIWTMTKTYAPGDVIEAFYWETDGVFVDRNIAGRMWAAEPVIGGGGGAST